MGQWVYPSVAVSSSLIGGGFSIQQLYVGETISREKTRCNEIALLFTRLFLSITASVTTNRNDSKATRCTMTLAEGHYIQCDTVSKIRNTVKSFSSI
jgi:hypothetical protein